MIITMIITIMSALYIAAIGNEQPSTATNHPQQATTIECHSHPITLFARSILLRVFSHARQGRPRLLVRGLVEEAPHGVVNESGLTTAGLEVGGNGVEALVVVTSVCVSGVFVSNKP